MNGKPWDGQERRLNAVHRTEHDNLARWVSDIDAKLDTHTEQEIRMEERLAAIEKSIASMAGNVEKLTEVWTQAKGAARVLVWVVGALSSLAGVAMWVKEHLR